MSRHSWGVRMHSIEEYPPVYTRSALAFPLTFPCMMHEGLWIHLMDKICVFSGGFFFSLACEDRLLFVTSWIIDVFVIRPLKGPSRPQWHSDVLGKARWLLRSLCIFNTHYDRGTERRSAKPLRGANQSTVCRRQIIRPTAYPPAKFGLNQTCSESID